MDELWMNQMFRSMKLSEDGVFLDFGANVGQTLLKWRSIHPESPYYGFEVLPECITYLNDLIELNQFKDTHIIDKVISNNPGKHTLHLHFDDPTDRTASLKPNTNFPVLKTLDIYSIRFLDFLRSFNIIAETIQLIKIDIEGSEIELLYELNDLLQDNSPAIIIEILPQNHSDTELKELADYLHRLHYTIYRIVKHKMKLKHLKKIDAIKQDATVEESDYVLLSDKAFAKNINGITMVD